MRPRSPGLSLVLIAGTMLAGLLVRFGRFGLPQGVVKYGGSALWALMIYWIVSALLPARRTVIPAVLAGVLATAVECFKLYRAPALDAFRVTVPGMLLLGRFFSVWDLVAYWVAIAAALVSEHAFRHAE